MENFAATRRRVLRVLCVLTAASCLPAFGAAWEPSKPVEFVVPAGTGGGADQIVQHGRTDRG